MLTGNHRQAIRWYQFGFQGHSIFRKQTCQKHAIYPTVISSDLE